MSKPLLVCVVDDDESVRESLPDLLKEFGYSTQVFSSAEAFLRSKYLNRTKCLILDVAMPGMSGPDLKRELEHRKLHIPIIFITARTDMGRGSEDVKGAVACLTKPFGDNALQTALRRALKKT